MLDAAMDSIRPCTLSPLLLSRMFGGKTLGTPSPPPPPAHAAMPQTLTAQPRVLGMVMEQLEGLVRARAV